MGKTKYSREPQVPTKAVKASAKDLRIHFKNTYEVVNAIKGMNLNFAQRYLKDVLERKRCVPFVRFTGCIGRTAQAKEFGRTQGRWPVKSVKVILGLLDNLVANASVILKFKLYPNIYFYIQSLKILTLLTQFQLMDKSIKLKKEEEELIELMEESDVFQQFFQFFIFLLLQLT
ncbi:hypothetical protein IMG5_196110 [Ichthyophthirius multifiliis]|uniref:60S ribosomal protein L17 n=1 Tax=Ichthyophthirius multifiliis TaxID=5932 RepID=G0R527_ICHMU|nr:hypothetical protein IMG5_196110 [Ichthyophthirius multifiliis]EGR27429.1 hypothetical protein IMG5_196110 [Ichthyophthirius multifiliis]|eukprot:XP_004024339.1 hypothetical protein IMG5_196110 [Ichthyophthirius multifiliis]